MNKNKHINKPTIVAVDLGSNSFHLLEASLIDGKLIPIDSCRQKVQLALDMSDGVISSFSLEKALSCLRQFSSFTLNKPSASVRIVGTQALRLACPDSQQIFASHVQSILGHPLEIITGEEEASLVYHAAIQCLEFKQSALVIDVGGGSTELALGFGDDLRFLKSISVGCISLLQFFPDKMITEESFERAYLHARRLFQPHSKTFIGESFDVIGCSGTLLAIEQVLIKQGWSRAGISLQGLVHLKSVLLSFKRIEEVQFQGLSEDRRSVFASGVAVALALFDAFDLKSMQLSDVALREGVALELLTSISITADNEPK